MGNRNRWFNKKLVFKKFEMIPCSIGIENLKAIVNFIAFRANK